MNSVEAFTLESLMLGVISLSAFFLKDFWSALREELLTPESQDYHRFNF